MNILHVCSDLEPEKGGVSAAVLGIAQFSAPPNATIRVVYGGVSQANRLDAGAACSFQHLDGSDNEKELASEIDWADVVHIHAVWDPIHRRAIDLCGKQSKPMVLSTHGMLDTWCLNHKWLKKKLFLEMVMRRRLKRVTALHATCSFEANMVRELGFGRPIHIVPLGVASEEFESSPPTAVTGSDQGRPFLIFLSRLHPIKGIELLIEGFAKANVADEVDLIIAGPGEGSYVEELQGLAAQWSIEHAVSFPGMISGAEKLQTLQNALCFVLPSHHENFSIATLEALASGTPAIVSDQVGLHEEITKADAGRVTRLDTTEIAAAIREVVGDAQLQHELGQNAKQLVRDNFYWEHLRERWRQVYDEVVDL